ncbi:MAG: hypothetical protein K8I60_08180 [Anaerolineae bacterium]|nr:hypothetical protein [Anaerolineae bacterium]
MQPNTYLSEMALRAELEDLIRYLYRKNLAEEIVADFERVFTRHPALEDRLTIIAHWVDFFRAHRYRKLMRRRRPTHKERMTACAACGYPVSHRHHLWDIATHGENTMTVQVCANCHELYHLMYNALARDSRYSRKLVLHMRSSGRIPDSVMTQLMAWCRDTLRYEVRNGWLEPDKATDEWLEVTLYWGQMQDHQDTAGTAP